MVINITQQLIYIVALLMMPVFSYQSTFFLRLLVSKPASVGFLQNFRKDDVIVFSCFVINLICVKLFGAHTIC